ncbi:MAG: hypothetical protein KIT56_06055 [Gammaproteobacteria bacterium]|nr:hypothetical protein [Gammaproteobacteria bacterium]MCW5583433.1 hypothetical protein [Gammaproteobacteria bacterium]
MLAIESPRDCTSFSLVCKRFLTLFAASQSLHAKAYKQKEILSLFKKIEVQYQVDDEIFEKQSKQYHTLRSWGASCNELSAKNRGYSLKNLHAWQKSFSDFFNLDHDIYFKEGDFFEILILQYGLHLMQSDEKFKIQYSVLHESFKELKKIKKYKWEISGKFYRLESFRPERDSSIFILINSNIRMQIMIFWKMMEN